MIQELPRFFIPFEYPTFQWFYDYQSTLDGRYVYSGILVRSGIEAQYIQEVSNIFSCTILVDNIYFTSYYIHATYNYSQSFKSFCSSIEFCNQSKRGAIFSGDCNGHSHLWQPLHASENAIGTQCEQVLLQHGAHILNIPFTSPTFKTEQGESWIDVSFSLNTLSNQFSNWQVLSDYATFPASVCGHFPTCFYFDELQSFPCTQPSTAWFYNWNSVHWQDFNQELSSGLSTCAFKFDTQHFSDIDHNVEVLSNFIQSFIEDNVPKRSLRVNYKPWWNSTLSKLYKLKQTSYKQYKRSQSIDDKNAHIIHKNRFRQHVLKFKQEYFDSLISKSSSIWDLQKRLTRQNKSPAFIPDFVDNDNQPHSYDNKYQFLLSSFFPPLSPLNHFQRQISEFVRLHKFRTLDTQLVFDDITEDELLQAVSYVNKHSAPGFDKISNKFISNTISILSPFLLQLFNDILKFSYHPLTWKQHKIIAVPKPGRKRQLPNSWRPISLLSCLSKLLELILTTRFLTFLRANNLLSSTQYGFRATRSPIFALHHFYDFVNKFLDKHQCVFHLSLDIQSAFDRLWHDGFLFKLQQDSCPLYLLKWFGSFLSHRQAYLYGDNQYYFVRISQGVPQGSPISPIMFIYFIKDLLVTLSTNDPTDCNITFADDIHHLLFSYFQSQHFFTFVDNRENCVKMVFQMENDFQSHQN